MSVPPPPSVERIPDPVPPPTDAVQSRLDGWFGIGWPFWLPMAVFLALVFVGGLDDGWYATSYAARTFVVGALLVWVWRRVRVDVAWTHLGLGTLVGVIGLVQWVGTDKLLQAFRDRFPDDWVWGGFWEMFVSGVRPGEGYDPVTHVWEPYGLAVFVAFTVVRFLGPVLVVPVMEELFWRDWLWRGLIAPNNWRLARLGEPDVVAFVGTSLAFAVVHPQRVVSVGWALLVAWLLVKTRSLGSVIVAHAVTNLLLGIYVLTAVWLGYTDEWYFW